MGYSTDDNVIIKVDNAEIKQQLVETAKEIPRKLYYKQSNVANASGNYVSFVFDDAYKLDYTKILPITTAKSIPISIAVITSLIGQAAFMTKEQLLEVQNTHGWEVMSHSHSHGDLDTFTEAQLDNDFATSQKILRDLGLGHESVVYPKGLYNSLVMKVANDYFRSALSCDHYNNNNPVDNQIPLETFKIKRTFIDSETLEQLKARVDNMNNTWIIFYSHSDGMSAAIEQKFKDIIDYVQFKNIPIQTVSNVLDKFENKFEVGTGNESGRKVRIGADNRLYADNVASEYLGLYVGIKNDTPLSFFKPRKISIASLTSVDASGIPYGGGTGTLLTYRTHEEDAVHFQEFHPMDNSCIVKRAWDKATGLWKAWVVYKPYNGITRRTVFPDFGTIPANTSTIFDVDCAGITNSGVLTATFQAALPAGIIAQVFISTTDKVKFMLSNVSISPLSVGVRAVTVMQTL